VDAEGDVIYLQNGKPLVIFGPSLDIQDENVRPF